MGDKRPSAAHCASREAIGLRPATLGRDGSEVGRASRLTHGGDLKRTAGPHRGRAGRIHVRLDRLLLLDAWRVALPSRWRCRYRAHRHARDSGYRRGPGRGCPWPRSTCPEDSLVPRGSHNAGRLAPTRAPQIAPTSAGHCGCGCGRPVRNRYRPGHDARHKEGLDPFGIGGPGRGRDQAGGPWLVKIHGESAS